MHLTKRQIKNIETLKLPGLTDIGQNFSRIWLASERGPFIERTPELLAEVKKQLAEQFKRGTAGMTGTDEAVKQKSLESGREAEIAVQWYFAKNIKYGTLKRAYAKGRENHEYDFDFIRPNGTVTRIEVKNTTISTTEAVRYLSVRIERSYADLWDVQNYDVTKHTEPETLKLKSLLHKLERGKEFDELILVIQDKQAGRDYIAGHISKTDWLNKWERKALLIGEPMTICGKPFICDRPQWIVTRCLKNIEGYPLIK